MSCAPMASGTAENAGPVAAAAGAAAGPISLPPNAMPAARPTTTATATVAVLLMPSLFSEKPSQLPTTKFQLPHRLLGSWELENWPLTPTSHAGASGRDLCGRPFVHFFSYGAPVPDEPRNSVCPLGSVRSRPFARCDPSFDW